MIIATLPPIYHQELSEEIAGHPLVSVLRYNTGMDSPYPPRETLPIIKSLCERFSKRLWLDLKGRQLHITEWVTPGYGEIKLDHEVEIDGPARIHFRGSGWTHIKQASGNTVYVDPLPPEALGKGQSVNIVGEKVTIKGKSYLTETDREYAWAAAELGVDGLMLSFVEQLSDLTEIMEIIDEEQDPLPPYLILKIESAKGLQFIQELPALLTGMYNKIFTMLARDDLYNELGDGRAVWQATREIIRLDPNAIAASRLFSSLEKHSQPALADFADWELLQQCGYGHFMLSDGLCLKNFSGAMAEIAKYLPQPKENC